MEGALPLGAALAADAIAHSIPGLNVLFGLVSEPLGAAAGACGVGMVVVVWGQGSVPSCLPLLPCRHLAAHQQSPSPRTGVAYMMSLVLSSPAVDPSTLAPKGTILDAEKAEDSRGNVRVPFTQITATTLKVGGVGGC